MTDFYVDVVASKEDKVVKRMGPMAERKAEKVDRGLNINLNHNDYYTMIRTQKEVDKLGPVEED